MNGDGSDGPSVRVRSQDERLAREDLVLEDELELELELSAMRGASTDTGTGSPAPGGRDGGRIHHDARESGDDARRFPGVGGRSVVSVDMQVDGEGGGRPAVEEGVIVGEL